MRGGPRPSYQSVRALFEQAEDGEQGGATASKPPLACPSPSPQPSQQPPLALLERLSSRAPVLGLERLSLQVGVGCESTWRALQGCTGRDRMGFGAAAL